MQPAAMTYVLQCNSCGIRGEIGEYMQSCICPKRHGEMQLFEAAISGDDALVDALLEQMINNAGKMSKDFFYSVYPIQPLT